MLEYIDRSGSDCYKWDSDEAQGCLPLWVADMDFAAAQPIRDAMQRRLDHGVFGYSIVPQANYDAVASWFERRHGWKGIHCDNLLYTTAVVPAISAILAALKERKAKSQELGQTCNSQLRVLTFTPAYNCFFSCIENMGCELVPSALVLRNNRFEIDFDDVERKAKQADVFLLCNPHNPTGRVWSRDELERLADIMRREHLFVLSDEIHCEFAFPGHPYTPVHTFRQHRHQRHGFLRLYLCQQGVQHSRTALCEYLRAQQGIVRADQPCAGDSRSERTQSVWFSCTGRCV